MESFKKRMYRIVEVEQLADTGERFFDLFDIFIIVLIVLNVLAVIMETVNPIYRLYKTFFISFEIFSVTVFAIEYLLRLWVCTVDKKYANPITGRIRFALTPMAIIDLMAILPFFLPMVFPFDLRFIRIFRLFRTMRVFKLGRYSKALQHMGIVFKRKKEELIMVAISLVIILVFISSLMFFVENEAQPSAFSSIPASMWWGVATLTTVGYGDMYPITPLGKFLGSFISLLGIAMFALPAGILASGFSEQLNKKNTIKHCPHCGKKLD